jgi:hypothetical protein
MAKWQQNFIERTGRMRKRKHCKGSSGSARWHRRIDLFV